MTLSSRLFAILTCLVLFVPAARAQTHFDSCSSQTGNSAVIIVPADAAFSVNGVELNAGDEVAVFTTDGICAGAIVWNDAHASLIAWGDDSMKSLKQGFDNDEKILFRVWQSETQTEIGGDNGTVVITYDDGEPFLSVDGRYGDGAIMLISGLVAETEVGTGSGVEALAQELRIAGNYPNPFQNSTTIAFDVPATSDVSISAFNLLGQKVASIYEGRVVAGSHSVNWDAIGIPSGVYLLRVETGTAARTTRAVIAR